MWQLRTYMCTGDRVNQPAQDLDLFGQRHGFKLTNPQEILSVKVVLLRSVMMHLLVTRNDLSAIVRFADTTAHNTI